MKIDQITEGYKVLPPIDKDKYQERDGLEGPYRLANGKVVYYDVKQGQYYDPDTDMYISYDDYQDMDRDRDFNEADAVDEVVQGWMARAAGKVIFDAAYKKAVEMLAKKLERDDSGRSLESQAADLLRMLRGGDKLDPKELAAMYRKQYATESQVDAKTAMGAKTVANRMGAKGSGQRMATAMDKVSQGQALTGQFSKEIAPFVDKLEKILANPQLRQKFIMLSQQADKMQESEIEEAVTAKVYKTNGKYWVVDVKSSKIDYTEWGPRGDGFASKEDAEAFAKKVTKEGLDEGTDFRNGDSVKHARTGEKGTVLHKGNRDQVVVKFGSLNKSLPASELRLVDELDEGVGEYTAKLLKKTPEFKIYDIMKGGEKVGVMKHHPDSDSITGKLHGKDLPDLGNYKYTGSGPQGKLHAFLKSKTGQKFVNQDELDEAPGAIRKGLAAVGMIAALWGVNDHMAQKAYDASPQLQKLTAYLEVAKQHNDKRMIDQLEQRIENHKARLDLGKGDVMGKDGRPIDVKYDKEMSEETKKDACYHKVRSRYKVWPSAYASGALVQCRKKGAKNWGNKSK